MDKRWLAVNLKKVFKPKTALLAYLLLLVATIRQQPISLWAASPSLKNEASRFKCNSKSLRGRRGTEEQEPIEKEKTVDVSVFSLLPISLAYLFFLLFGFFSRIYHKRRNTSENLVFKTVWIDTVASFFCQIIRTDESRPAVMYSKLDIHYSEGITSGT